MVVVSDHDFATHQHIVAYLNHVSGGDMDKMTDADMIPNDNLGRKPLFVMPGDGFQPEALSCREILSHID
jgi:hypothetical protein